MTKTQDAMSSHKNVSMYIDGLGVSNSKRSSIEILWRTSIAETHTILGYRVHYQKVASSYIQYGPKLSSSDHTYNVQNLVPDTYYKICLSMLRNGTSTTKECITASTQSWDLPVSVGSSIGAVLALALIVVLILMIRCRSAILCKGKPKSKPTKYDTVSSHCNEDTYEFSPSVTQNSPPNDVSKTPKETHYRLRTHSLDYNERRNNKTGAIPKILRSSTIDDQTQQERCNCNNTNMNLKRPNGILTQRMLDSALSGTTDNYHDNAIILHVSGDSPVDNLGQTGSSGAKTRSDKPTRQNQEFEMSNRNQPLFSDSNNCKYGSREMLSILLSFPNADSCSDTTENDYETGNLSDVSIDADIDSNSNTGQLELPLNTYISQESNI